MSSASIVGSFMVVCGERPVVCFATCKEARDHARLLRAGFADEVEVFVCEVHEMVATILQTDSRLHDIELLAPLEEQAA